MSLNAHHRIYAKKPRLSATPIASLALVGSILCLSQAFGQGQSSGGQSPAGQSPSGQSTASISDQQIKEAANAIPQVEGIRQNYQQQLAQASDSDKQRIQGQAGVEMKKAITDQGLSIPEYNSILQAAEEHPEIRTRLIQQMPQADHSPAGKTPGP